jgi:hypothetical protein
MARYPKYFLSLYNSYEIQFFILKEQNTSAHFFDLTHPNRINTSHAEHFLVFSPLSLFYKEKWAYGIIRSVSLFPQYLLKPTVGDS